MREVQKMSDDSNLRTGLISCCSGRHIDKNVAMSDMSELMFAPTSVTDMCPNVWPPLGVVALPEYSTRYVGTFFYLVW